MNKFKKWLIHKLGGYCKDDLLPIPKLENEKDKQVCFVKSHVISTDFLKSVDINDIEEKYINEEIQEFKQDLIKRIKPNVEIKDWKEDYKEVVCSITISQKYVDYKEIKESDIK